MAALQVFEEMQSNAILPDEVSVLAEPKMIKLQSKSDEDFQGDLFLRRDWGGPNLTKCDS